MSVSDLSTLQAEFDEALSQAQSAADLKAVRDRFLGRKSGRLTALLKTLGSLPPDERRTVGAAVNALKQTFEARLAEREAAVGSPAPFEGVDITLPGRRPALGRRHPLTQVRERIEDIFAGMGYQIIEGPELEDDWHNFEALNMPAEHPARDMQDTLYLSAPMPADASGRRASLLRTHTSGMQIRYMEAHEPPVRLIAPGRVYRRDNFDATHTPMFTQVEGLVVDRDISLGDLKGTLQVFAEQFFGAGVATRLRPSFFPYTEPSAELDVECQGCGGRGCPLCKYTGWIEVLGCGMVHPAVFEAVGYDPEQYTGFAFGVGIERLALRLYGVDDIRMFYENDLRFLEQLAP
ncbi:MAG: phenylalanine--tRNA ligase subunit alpha [Acidobacteriota bacterium]|jgi:phenylalanyl-tRNA synthetase alpha chain|nr:MAG: phenylalanine--tRNA ligase subunit alpha [Acidobacteriota bacterium]